MIELIEMLLKHNTLITINICGIFCILNISFKICNNASIIPRFGKKCFHQFLFSVFKINDTVSFEDNFFTFLVVIKPESSVQSL